MTKILQPTTEDFITDEQLLSFFDAKEAGKSFPDAINASGLSTPSQKETDILRSLWEMHGNLMRQAHNTTPRHDLLVHIMERIEDAPSSSSVREKKVTSQIAPQGTSVVFGGMNKYFRFIEKINWKILVSSALILLIFVSATGNKNTAVKSVPLAVNEIAEKTIQAPTLMAVSSDEPQALPVADLAMRATINAGPESAVMLDDGPLSSTDIDTFALLVNGGADVDASILDDTDGDVTLIFTDSQSISDFVNAYDETTF